MKMKRIIYMLAAAVALTATLVACGDDDDNGGLRGGDRQFAYNTLDHVVNQQTGAVTVSQGRLTGTINLNTLAVQGLISLNPGSGQPATLNFGPFTAQNQSNVYRFANTDSSLVGTLNFNEASLRLRYVTGNYRVISTTRDIFTADATTRATYNDTTASSSQEADYQFTIDPATMTATVTMMAFVHTRDYRFLRTVTGGGAKVQATAQGYVVTADNLPTTAIYVTGDKDNRTSSGSGVTTSTTAYPITHLQATLNLESDLFEASFNLGGAPITVSGTLGQ